jgi:hypothetical protein
VGKEASNKVSAADRGEKDEAREEMERREKDRASLLLFLPIHLLVALRSFLPSVSPLCSLVGCHSGSVSTFDISLPLTR